MQAFLFFVAVLVGPWILKRIYYRVRFAIISEDARYKWHLLNDRNKRLFLCSQWNSKISQIQDNEYHDKESIKKVYLHAQYVTENDARVEMEFDKVLKDVWRCMTVASDYDMPWARAQLDKKFISYDLSSQHFLAQMERFLNEDKSA